MNFKDLFSKSLELRAELFGLKLNSISKPVKDKSVFKKLRKDIARALYYMSVKRNSMNLKYIFESLNKQVLPDESSNNNHS